MYTLLAWHSFLHLVCYCHERQSCGTGGLFQEDIASTLTAEGQALDMHSQHTYTHTTHAYTCTLMHTLHTHSHYTHSHCTHAHMHSQYTHTHTHYTHALTLHTHTHTTHMHSHYTHKLTGPSGIRPRNGSLYSAHNLSAPPLPLRSVVHTLVLVRLQHTLTSFEVLVVRFSKFSCQ